MVLCTTSYRFVPVVQPYCRVTGLFGIRSLHADCIFLSHCVADWVEGRLDVEILECLVSNASKAVGA